MAILVSIQLAPEIGRRRAGCEPCRAEPDIDAALEEYAQARKKRPLFYFSI